MKKISFLFYVSKTWRCFFWGGCCFFLFLKIFFFFTCRRLFLIIVSPLPNQTVLCSTVIIPTSCSSTMEPWESMGVRLCCARSWRNTLVNRKYALVSTACPRFLTSFFFNSVFYPLVSSLSPYFFFPFNFCFENDLFLYYSSNYY